MADIIKRQYKNIIGDTKSTIDAIQKFLAKSADNDVPVLETEDTPCESVNRILNSVVTTNDDIQKIINSL